MAELADAQASGACGSNVVWVQVPSPASEFFSPRQDTELGYITPAVIKYAEVSELADEQD